MKYINRSLLLLSVLCAAVLFSAGNVHGAYVVLFVGSAASVSWSDVRRAAHQTGSQIFAAPVLVATLPVTHEDLSDQMVLLEAEEMLFESAVPKGPPAENVVFMAALDKLDAPRLGGEKDGQKINRDNVKNRQANRDDIFGTVQHFRESYGASIVAQTVMKPAGITDVIADGKFKTLLALKQKMELTDLSDQDSQKITGSVAGLTRGAIQWANSSAQPNSAYAVPAAFRPLAAQRVSVANTAAITEALFKTMLLNLRKARQKKIDVLAFCTMDAAQQFDSFFSEQVPVAGSAVPTRHFNWDGDADVFEQMVTTYATRFGKITPNPTDYLNGLRDSATGLTGDTTSGSAVIAGLLNVPTDDDGNSALQPFSPIAGTGIPAGAYIVSVDSATQITISANATANGNDIALRLGVETHMFFTDMKYWEKRTNLVPSHKPLPEDSGGEDGYCESISGLFCTYPALLGLFFTA
jgi:hypothetical protein